MAYVWDRLKVRRSTAQPRQHLAITTAKACLAARDPSCWRAAAGKHQKRHATTPRRTSSKPPGVRGPAAAAAQQTLTPASLQLHQGPTPISPRTQVPAPTFQLLAFRAPVSSNYRVHALDVALGVEAAAKQPGQGGAQGKLLIS